jgi:hypothetical protein
LGHVVLALILGEGDDRNALLGREALQTLHEVLGHGIHQRRGGKAVSAVEAEKLSHPLLGLQAGHVDIEVHAVDALQLKGDVIFEDLGDGAWYSHSGLRWWTRAITWPIDRIAVNTSRTFGFALGSAGGAHRPIVEDCEAVHTNEASNTAHPTWPHQRPMSEHVSWV